MRFLLKFALLSILLAPVLAHAHGPVTTLSKTVGDYRIEFEYNTLGSIFAGDYTIYNTYLLQVSNVTPVDFDSAFIRVSKKNGPAVFAGSFAEASDKKGFANFSALIQDVGTYTAEIVFYKSGKNLVGAQFDFEVKDPDSLLGSKPVPKDLMLEVGLVLIGLALGTGITLWIKNRNKI